MFDNISRYTEKDIENILGDELGPGYISYREEWNKSGLDNVPSFPIHIDFEINDKCNQKCVMCPRNAKSHSSINYELNTGFVLNFKNYKKIIDEGVDKGLMSVNLGAFAEPLLHKDVFKMVAYAHEKGVIESRVITNGLLLNRFTEESFESGLVNLFVSLDAFSEETYKEIRGHGFDVVKKNLLGFFQEKLDRKSMLPITRVSFIDMNGNGEEKKKFIDFWRGKADIVDIQIFDNFDIDIRRPFDKSIKKKWECRSPWARICILANGDVLPCCNFFGRNIPIGNIRNDTIEEAWKSQAMKKVREGILNDSLDNCSVCQRAGG